MSVFNSLFGTSESSNSSNINWISLTQIQQLHKIIDDSFQSPILIFKHSTRCAISRMSLKQFEKQFNLQQQITPYFLDLLQHRDISDEIARRFEVPHQSPQILLIKQGKSIYDASHEAIDASRLPSAL